MTDEQPTGPEAILLKYGIDIGFLVSGFFGSLLLVSKKSSQKLKTTIASILAGMACANYLTPVALALIPESVRGGSKYAMAFVLGFMGLKGLEYIIEKYFVGEEEAEPPRRVRRVSSKPKKKRKSTSTGKRR